jgi:hypothetical protein
MTSEQRAFQELCQYTASANAILGDRKKLDWQQANSISSQLAQALCAVNRLIGALDAKADKTAK